MAQISKSAAVAFAMITCAETSNAEDDLGYVWLYTLSACVIEDATSLQLSSGNTQPAKMFTWEGSPTSFLVEQRACAIKDYVSNDSSCPDTPAAELEPDTTFSELRVSGLLPATDQSKWNIKNGIYNGGAFQNGEDTLWLQHDGRFTFVSPGITDKTDRAALFSLSGKCTSMQR